MPSSFPAGVDRLFTLPLSEFVAARNALAAQLKRERRAADAEAVKEIPKPAVSVWAVNQLYWKYRDAFDRLIETGKTLREAHRVQFEGRARDGARDAMSSRREAVDNLLRLADALLRDAGHSPAQETMRRIAVTLEALSARPEALPYGCLTEDLDPPGFDLLAAWMPAVGFGPKRGPPPVAAPSPKTKKTGAAGERRSRIANLRGELTAAERELRMARTKAAEGEAAMRRAASEAIQAELRKDQAHESYERAKTAFLDATGRARESAAESDAAGKVVETAEGIVARLSKDLHKLESEK